MADKKFSDFKIFSDLSDNIVLKKVYQNMQRNYVFLEEDILPFNFIPNEWKKLQEVLNDL